MSKNSSINGVYCLYYKENNNKPIAISQSHCQSNYLEQFFFLAMRHNRSCRLQ